MANASEDRARDDESRAPVAHGGEFTIAATRAGALALRVTRALALIGGVFLLIAVVVTLVSVVGRYTFASPVPGDYEIVEIGVAVAVFLFFPFTHAVGGNIAAEFFTSGLSRSKQIAIDLVHDIVFAGIAALLTWRLTHGLIEKYVTGDTSILIHPTFPK